MTTAVAEAPKGDSNTGGILDGLKFDELMQLVYHAGFQMYELLPHINLNTLEDLIVEGGPSTDYWTQRDEGHVHTMLDAEYNSRVATAEQQAYVAKDIQHYLASDWMIFD